MIHRCQKYENRDPHRLVPFVETDPPKAGVTYWLVCAVVIGALGVLAYLGAWK